MKKAAYLLSLALHALLLLVILHSEFRVTIIPEPPRVVAVRIAEPPLPYFAPVAASAVPMGDAARGALPGRADAGVPRQAAMAGARIHGAAASSGATDFRLAGPGPGTFRLAPVGKSPEPWAIAQAASGAQGPLRYPSGVIDPLSPQARLDPARFSGGVFLIAFDSKEKAVAEWTQAVLTRIERNWIVPASARFAYSGRIQVTLVIEKDGRSQALAVGESSLPAILSQAAQQAIQASLPLPPLPENIAGETFAFTFVFVYNG